MRHLEVVGRRGDEATFTQDWLGNHSCDLFVGDDAFERVFEMACAVEIAGGIFQVVGTAIAVGKWDAVNVAGEWREAGLVGMSLAGEGERHHGAAVEGVFEGDDGGTFGVGAGNLNSIFDGFSAAVDEQRLLGKLAGSDFIHALGQADVTFVGRDLDAGMEEFVELDADGVDYGLLAMAGVGAADASGEIDVAVAVDVFEPGVFGFGYVDGRAVGEAAGHGFGTAVGERAGVGAGNGCVDLNCAHFSFSGELPEAAVALRPGAGSYDCGCSSPLGAKNNPRSG